MSSQEESSKSSISYSLISFICWCIVYAKTNRETFDALGSSYYYDLASVSVWGNVGYLVSLFIISSIAAAAIVTDNDCCLDWTEILAGFTTFVFIGVLLTQFVFMCLIIHNDNDHYIIVYDSFWRSRAFNYSSLEQPPPSPHPSVQNNLVTKPSEIWPYDMADIIIRIYSGITFILLFIIATGLAIFIISAIVSLIYKKCSSKESSSSNHTLDTVVRNTRTPTTNNY